MFFMDPLILSPRTFNRISLTRVSRKYDISQFGLFSPNCVPDKHLVINKGNIMCVKGFSFIHFFVVVVGYKKTLIAFRQIRHV